MAQAVKGPCVDGHKLRLAHIGCGRWGANIVRELVAHPLVELVVVVDTSEAAQHAAQTLCPTARIERHVRALEAYFPQAVTIASPGGCHARHSAMALGFGADVFVEKPMTIGLTKARQLVMLSERLGRVGMVGHLLRYHPAVQKMLQIVRAGVIGEPLWFRSERLCVTNSRDTEESVLWSLAPHDVSLLFALDPGGVCSSELSRGSRSLAGRPTRMSLRFVMNSGLQAHIVVSRGSDTKVRCTTVVGREGWVCFDDASPRASLLLRTSTGSYPVPVFSSRTPLQSELDTFVRCVRTRCQPVTDFREGLRVVEALHQLEISSAVSARRPSLAVQP